MKYSNDKILPNYSQLCVLVQDHVTITKNPDSQTGLIFFSLYGLQHSGTCTVSGMFMYACILHVDSNLSESLAFYFSNFPTLVS